jgi:hypothetical protein
MIESMPRVCNSPACGSVVPPHAETVVYRNKQLCFCEPSCIADFFVGLARRTRSGWWDDITAREELARLKEEFLRHVAAVEERLLP